MKQQNKQIIFDYIANVLEKDKQRSDFDPSYKSISKENVFFELQAKGHSLTQQISLLIFKPIT